MKSFRFFRSNIINSSRSISTNTRRLNSEIDNSAMSSLLNYPINQDNNQNPLKHINESNATKRIRSVLQFDNRILKLPQVKNKNIDPVLKKKIKMLNEKYKRLPLTNTTLYFIRNRSKAKRNESSNNNSNSQSNFKDQSTLEMTRCFSSNKKHPISKENTKKGSKMILNYALLKTNSLSVSNQIMKKINYISQMANKKHSGSSSALRLETGINKLKDQAMLLPYETVKENLSNTQQAQVIENSQRKKKQNPLTQREIIVNSSTGNGYGTTQLAIHQNILTAYKGKTKAGKNENNMSKMNQDSFLIITSLYNMTDFNVFAVFDGHGLNGHLVGDFTKENIRQALLNHKDLNFLNSIEDIYLKLIENNYTLINNLFKATESHLFKETFDSHYSGTTALVLFQVGHHLICANIGNSRAIVIEDNDNNNQSYQVKPLSHDQQPHHYNEKKRIEKAGGRVEQYSGINYVIINYHLELGIKAGPYRVWYKKEDYPGLAISRSIGDLIASTIGVIAVPEIIEYEITITTRYVILASDGVWEFIDNTKAMNATKLFYQKNNLNGLCSNLIYEATAAWEKEDNVIDDITVVTLFFN